jgi:hypothetical protein
VEHQHESFVVDMLLGVSIGTIRDHLWTVREVEITREGLRHLGRPPDKVRSAVIETTFDSIVDNLLRASRCFAASSRVCTPRDEESSG